MAKNVGYIKDLANPLPGLYRSKVRIGRTAKHMPIYGAVAVWIDYGQPFDPWEPGVRLDRSPRLQAWKNGVEVDPYEVWPWCGEVITLEEYEAILAEDNRGDWDQ